MPTYIKRCKITGQANTIIARCDCFDNSEAIGIQMLVQLKDLSNVHKLYANRTADCQAPINVSVEKDGLYQVTIFPIIEHRGILGFDPEHMEDVMVNKSTMNGIPKRQPPSVLLPCSSTLLQEFAGVY